MDKKRLTLAAAILLALIAGSVAIKTSVSSKKTINNLQNNVNEQASTIGALNTKVSALNDTVGVKDTIINNQRQEIKTLKNNVEEQTNIIGKLKNKLGFQSKVIKEQKQEIDSLRTEVALKDSALAQYASRSESVAKQASQLQAQVEAIVEEAGELSLNTDKVDMKSGETVTLIALITPNSLKNSTVIWESSNPSVASVENGVVTAHSNGTTTITASAFGKTATCIISIDELVDLGLSVKWATCNLGARRPEQFGDFYAWGETEVKDDYSWENYLFGTMTTEEECGSDKDPLKKYVQGGRKYDSDRGIASSRYDVAFVDLGEGWHIPTYEEVEELLQGCTWKWFAKGNADFNGVPGFKVTSKKEGFTDKFIFLPAAGFTNEKGLKNVDQWGCYWTSVSDDNYIASGAYGLRFDVKEGPEWVCGHRNYGFAIRPVYGNVPEPEL